LNTLATIAERKAGFRSLGDSWADTTSAHGRLMLTVLGGLAEFERELIRIGEGRARARARGVKMGRPPKMTPHQMKEALHPRSLGYRDGLQPEAELFNAPRIASWQPMQVHSLYLRNGFQEVRDIVWKLDHGGKVQWLPAKQTAGAPLSKNAPA
jgi:Resolvase, N terminal domain